MPIDTITIDAIRIQMPDGEIPNLIDVRTAAEYYRLHVRGARSIPLDQLEPGAMGQLHGVAGGPTYLICQSGTRSAQACERLSSAGLTQVYSVEGGTAAWEAAGLPVERGRSRVISLERQVRIAAGSLVTVGTALASMVNQWFLVVPLFIGLGLVFAGVSGSCGMGLLLAKMPWNAVPAAKH